MQQICKYDWYLTDTCFSCNSTDHCIFFKTDDFLWFQDKKYERVNNIFVYEILQRQRRIFIWITRTFMNIEEAWDDVLDLSMLQLE